MQKPVLSIGIIFKNEIRCLERCVKSLQPVRDAVPCELVMADTGSDDGSREIAERYADILIDFPWINDFSAARNAVLDRCSGTWHLAVDADEWLDEDVSQLTDFLRSPEIGQKYSSCALIIRNYTSADLKGDYSDFLGARMFRRSAGVRYEGAIHEHWNREVGTLYGLGKTVLHHDGYVDFNGERGKAKRERNMELLRKRLEDSPKNLMLLLQCIESAAGEEQERFIRRAIAGIQEKWDTWEQAGPPIYRHAVNIAQARSMPEFDEWREQAQTLFPDSLFIRVDVGYAVFMRHAEKKEYAQAIPAGENYLEALSGYRTTYDRIADIAYSSLMFVSAFREEQVRILLADAYFFDKQFEKSKEMLATIDGGGISVSNVKNYTGILMNLHGQSGLDMRDALSEFWTQLNAEQLEEKDRTARRNELYAAAVRAFPRAYREAEDEKGFRHGYTLFLPLKGQCGIGDAAELLETLEAGRLEAILSRQEDFALLPAAAIAHALEYGARFPLPDKPLSIEAMDSLAARLLQDRERLLPLTLHTAQSADPEDWQGFCWVRGLVMAAVHAYPWRSEEQDEEQGMALARAFAKLEEAFLPMCYSAGVLVEERLFVLPPMHRFGWYCAQAFGALERGGAAEYVRLLRAGLDTCKDMKPMVEFLADHTAEVQRLLTPPELKALADQVRVILARFSPDDPAVAALKQSEAYQKVAHLIEGAAAPVWGGLPQ